MQPDIDDPSPPPELVALDRVLDRLLSLLHDTEADRLDAAARGYVEDAIEAAMAAAVRARDNDLAGAAAGPIGEAAAVARALLAELRSSTARSESLVNRSLELRRQAIRLTASALTLRRQPRRADPRMPSTPSASPAPAEAANPRDGTDGLHGVRVLVVGNGPGLVERFTMLLSVLGADVRAASSMPEAVEGAWVFHPHVLVCEVPAVEDRATALIRDLRREKLGMPAVAVVASADAAFREAGRRAGFADVLAGPITFSELAAGIRQAVDG
jgi:CheY-like chemotaxis protein